jgi:hypothetical protein
MARTDLKRRAWTVDNIRTLKTLARKKTHAAAIARKLKRTEGATRQKAFSLGLSLDSRAWLSLLKADSVAKASPVAGLFIVGFERLLTESSRGTANILDAVDIE